MRDENYVEKATTLWAQQVEHWLDSANVYQSQFQKFTDRWVEQATEAQKETQRLMKEWSDTASKSQVELLKAWQGAAKETAAFFSPKAEKGHSA
ncbi:MAG: hypothetical protein HZB55_22615 [Deltaproteobacteria bacterium]|nr:hypothetical protein [Deltaproteobacteria bacterium]